MTRELFKENSSDMTLETGWLGGSQAVLANTCQLQDDEAWDWGDDRGVERKGRCPSGKGQCMAPSRR